MHRETLLECLCPYCHSTIGFNERIIVNPKQPSAIHCSSCFAQFDIMVVDGVGQTKNVIVLME